MPPAAPPSAKPVGIGKPSNPLKKIPVPVLLMIGGAAIGLVYVLIRDRGMHGTGATDATDEVAGEGTVEDPSLAMDPSPVAYVSPNVPLPEPAETVGAVGQTALESLIGALVPLISKQDPTVASLVEALTAKPPQASSAPVILNKPPAPAKPKGGPKPKVKPLPAHYKHGNPPGFHIGGALGWTRVASGGKGRAHWIDYHIATAHTLQRWRIWPNKKGDPKKKIWQKGR